MTEVDVNDRAFGEAAYCHHRHHLDEHSTDFDTCPHPICVNARAFAEAVSSDARILKPDGSQSIGSANETSSSSLRADLARLTEERDTLQAKVIDHLQREEAITRLGQLLEGLRFWPHVDGDANLARDAGRLLLGKPAERSNLDESFRVWHGPVLPLLQRATKAEADLARLTEALRSLPRFRLRHERHDDDDCLSCEVGVERVPSDAPDAVLIRVEDLEAALTGLLSPLPGIVVVHPKDALTPLSSGELDELVRRLQQVTTVDPNPAHTRVWAAEAIRQLRCQLVPSSASTGRDRENENDVLSRQSTPSPLSGTGSPRKPEPDGSEQ